MIYVVRNMEGRNLITISLCMIIRDEEKSLRRCLSSVQHIVDEIIIVDTGSKDRSKEIASELGAKVYDFTWIDDFAAARNYAFSKATAQYILWLDADDVVKEEDQHRFLRLKETLSPDVQTVTMPYHLSFDAKGNVTTSLRRNRLVRRDCQFKWIGAVHEYLEVWGKSLASDVCITHLKDKTYSDRNLKIYRAKQEKGEPFSPRDLYYFANELRDHQLYEEACKYYDQFLDTGKGWIEDNFQACLKLAECYERQGKPQEQLKALLRTLQYDRPRAQFCYRIGYYFHQKDQFKEAEYWYQQAIDRFDLAAARASLGMTNIAEGTWLPHLQLVLCYDKQGKYKEAHYHNELALNYSPAHPSMLYNRNYFKGILGDHYFELRVIDLAEREEE